MTSDELDKKIIDIKKRGLANFVENQLIKELRREFYEQKVQKNIRNISDRFRRNILFLNKIHGENCSAGKIKEFMGIDVEQTFNKVLYEEKSLYSLFQASLASEFFGLPTELILFTDLEANAELIKREYPALFKQSRN